MFMEAILTLKSKKIPRYYSTLIYGAPISLILLVSLIDEDTNLYKIFIVLSVLIWYLDHLFRFDHDVMNEIKMYDTIEVFQDHILIDSSYKLYIKDINCERRFGPAYPPSGIVFPSYDFVYIKDNGGRVRYEIYFKVIWHDVFDYSSYKFVELINSLKFRVEAIDKGNEMVTKLKQQYKLADEG